MKYVLMGDGRLAFIELHTIEVENDPEGIRTFYGPNIIGLSPTGDRTIVHCVGGERVLVYESYNDIIRSVTGVDWRQ